MILLALFLAAAPPADYPAWAQPIPIIINPLVTPETIKKTICVSGWTKTQRPPVSYTNKIKFGLMDAQHLPRSQASFYELDHVVSIEDSGSPTDPRNLRLQPWTGHLNARTKDKLETALKRDLCAGRRTILEVQHMLADDWPTAYQKEFGVPAP